MSRASHYKNRLVCGHRSWLSTTAPDSPTIYCFGCDQHSAVVSEHVEGFAHPERRVRDSGKFGMKSVGAYKDAH